MQLKGDIMMFFQQVNIVYVRQTPCKADTWQTDKLDIYFCTESPCF